MTDQSGPTPPLGAISLVFRSFQLLAAHFGFLFPLAAVPSLALAALSFLIAPSMGDMEPIDGTQFGGPALALSVLIDLLLSFVITGVMCLASLDALLGKRHGIGDYLRQTLRHIGPIVVLGVLISVATGLGTVLLVAPGLYIIGRYLPWTPAVVFENAGWSGLQRAQALTEGYRWPLAGAALLLGALLIVAVLVLSPLLSAATTSAALAILIEGVFSGFYYSLIAIFTALVYMRLREIKEGMTAGQIAESID